MKKITALILAALMLFSLTACGQEKPDPDQLAFEAACALLEEGKYKEAYAALTTLESYRKIQEKIDEAAAGIEAERLAEEEAARLAELEKVRPLLGMWKNEEGTIELTFQENMLCHYREWVEPTMTREIDYAFTMADETPYLEAFPVADQELKTDLGFPITLEDRDGVTHLLIAGFDFTFVEE